MKIDEPEDLTAWRKARRMSQSELALALGVNKSTVYRWEAGERPMPGYLSAALSGLPVRKARSA